MRDITPETSVRLSITKLIGIIGFVLGLGFTGGGIYIKLTILATDVKEIHFRVKRIEEKLDLQYGKQDKDSKWYTDTNTPIR